MLAVSAMVCVLRSISYCLLPSKLSATHAQHNTLQSAPKALRSTTFDINLCSLNCQL